MTENLYNLTISSAGFETLSGEIQEITDKEIVLLHKVKRSSKYVKMIIPFNDQVLLVARNQGREGDIVVRATPHSIVYDEALIDVKPNGPAGMWSGKDDAGNQVNFRPEHSVLKSDKMDAPGSSKKKKKLKDKKSGDKSSKSKPNKVADKPKRSRESWD